MFIELLRERDLPHIIAYMNELSDGQTHERINECITERHNESINYVNQNTHTFNGEGFYKMEQYYYFIFSTLLSIPPSFVLVLACYYRWFACYKACLLYITTSTQVKWQSRKKHHHCQLFRPIILYSYEYYHLTYQRWTYACVWCLYVYTLMCILSSLYCVPIDKLVIIFVQ